MHPITQLTVPTDKIGIHWFEQSSYALKSTSGTLLLTDPYFPTDRPSEHFIHPQPPVNAAELPADIVLLTHSHLDHTHPESIAPLHAAHPNVIYVGPQDAIDKVIAGDGIDPSHTRVIQAGDTIQVKDVVIHAVYSKPPAGDPSAKIAPPDVPHLGYVIEMSGKRIYVSGDPIHTFANLPEMVDPVAALKPDIGFLTTHPSEGEFPFFPGSALMAQRIGLKVAVPAHYQCFVKRNYDPQEWAKHFTAESPQTLIIEHNSAIVWG